MRVTIRPLTDADVAPVVAFSLAAWLPVFEGIEAELGPEVHRMLFPDWRSAQAQVITALCTAPDTDAWVAVVDDRPIGVVVVREIDEDAARAGEITLLGVDPGHQGAGVGSSLIERARARPGAVREAALQRLPARQVLPEAVTPGAVGEHVRGCGRTSRARAAPPARRATARE